MMSAKKPDAPSGAGSPVPDKEARPALPLPGPETRSPETGQPGGGRGRIDVTGVGPEGIRVDPDLTEGHPGYEESGESEVIPGGRLAQGGPAEEKGSG